MVVVEELPQIPHPNGDAKIALLASTVVGWDDDSKIQGEAPNVLSETLMIWFRNNKQAVPGAEIIIKTIENGDSIKKIVQTLCNWAGRDAQPQVAEFAKSGLLAEVLDYLLSPEAGIDQGNPDKLEIVRYLLKLVAICVQIPQEDRDAINYRLDLSVERPLDIRGDIALARSSLRQHLAGRGKEVVSLTQSLSRGNLRDSLREQESGKESECSRTASFVLLMDIIGGVLDSDERFALMALNEGVIALSHVVKIHALHGVASVMDRRRRGGLNVKALPHSQDLLVLTESMLSLVDGRYDTESYDLPVQSCMTLVWWLLIRDKERADEDVVESTNVVGLITEPYFMGAMQGDPGRWQTGIQCLIYLWLTDRRECVKFVILNEMCHAIMVAAMVELPNFPKLQVVGATLVASLLEAPETRSVLLADGVLDILAGVCMRSETSLELRAKICSGMARASLHDEATRSEVFSNFSFFGITREVLASVAPLDDAAIGLELTRNVLEIVFFLSLHASFKAQLMMAIAPHVDGSAFIRVEDRTAMIKAPELVAALPRLGNAAIREKDSVAQFLYVGIITNLTRASTDKEKLKPQKGMPMWDDSQLEEVQMMMERLPEGAKPKANGEFDRGDDTLCAEIVTALLDSECFKYLCNVLHSEQNVSTGLAAQVGRAIFQVITKGRDEAKGKMIKWGAFKAMLNAVSVLERNEEFVRSAKHDIRDYRQGLAILAMGVHPSSLSYAEKMSLIPPMMKLLNEGYELLNFEGFLVLTNLAGSDVDCRGRMLAGKGFVAISHAMCSDNKKVRQAGIELIANLSQDDRLRDKWAEGRWRIELNILILSLSEYGYEGIMHAAGGALAMASEDLRVGLRILYCCEKTEQLIEALMSVMASRDLAMGARVLAIWDHIVQAAIMGIEFSGEQTIDNSKLLLAKDWEKNFKPVADYVVPLVCKGTTVEQDVVIPAVKTQKVMFEHLLKRGRQLYKEQ